MVKRSPKQSHDVTQGGAAHAGMGSCSRCGVAVESGESGWTWYSVRAKPGYFGAASVGVDDFYCPACSSLRP